MISRAAIVMQKCSGCGKDVTGLVMGTKLCSKCVGERCSREDVEVMRK